MVTATAARVGATVLAAVAAFTIGPAAARAEVRLVVTHFSVESADEFSGEVSNDTANARQAVVGALESPDVFVGELRRSGPFSEAQLRLISGRIQADGVLVGAVVGSRQRDERKLELKLWSARADRFVLTVDVHLRRSGRPSRDSVRDIKQQLIARVLALPRDVPPAPTEPVGNPSPASHAPSTSAPDTSAPGAPDTSAPGTSPPNGEATAPVTSPDPPSPDASDPDATDAAPGVDVAAVDVDSELEVMADLDQLQQELSQHDHTTGVGGAGRRFELSKGFVASEFRQIVSDLDAEGNEARALAEIQLEVRVHFTSRLTLYVRPWLLTDALDTELLRYEPLDGYLGYTRGRWDVRLGQFVENWGSVDAFNPIAVLNRNDLGTNFLDPTARGELGARLRVAASPGGPIDELTASVYAIPLWRETPLPTADSRFQLSGTHFRPDLTERPELDDALFVALRVEHTLSTDRFDADLQYIVARGPDRMPVFRFSPQMDGTIDLIPEYHGTWTVGVGLQAIPTASGWLKLTFKGELAHKEPYRLPSVGPVKIEPYTQYGVGLERRFSGVLLTRDELFAIAEYYGEFGADDLPHDLRPFDSDVAVGFRWAVNDFSRTVVESVVTTDVTSGEIVGVAKITRHLRFVHDDLSLTVMGHYFRPSTSEASLFSLVPNNRMVGARMQYSF